MRICGGQHTSRMTCTISKWKVSGGVHWEREWPPFAAHGTQISWSGNQGKKVPPLREVKIQSTSTQRIKNGIQDEPPKKPQRNSKTADSYSSSVADLGPDSCIQGDYPVVRDTAEAKRFGRRTMGSWCRAANSQSKGWPGKTVSEQCSLRTRSSGDNDAICDMGRENTGGRGAGPKKRRKVGMRRP
ncbi:hypothetical protein B0H17DRAFT_1129789 [Mycena rosella]|uniref:Uncharacterized protein n=1 Tax=Mycena rosella TaxID=1033263 RepID=A0AAD7DRS9_MYCRO|nr:hypothetical protein B0H17DRAFT_1129789 [Mycena rosella]